MYILFLIVESFSGSLVIWCIIYFRPRGRYVVSCRRGLCGYSVHMSGISPLAIGCRIRGLNCVQPKQMDDGSFWLHSYVVNYLTVMTRVRILKVFSFFSIALQRSKMMWKTSYTAFRSFRLGSQHFRALSFSWNTRMLDIYYIIKRRGYFYDSYI